MKMLCRLTYWVVLLSVCLVVSGVLFADDESAVAPGQLREYGIHNAGRWTISVGPGQFPMPAAPSVSDPETGISASNGTFFEKQAIRSMYNTGLLIGGIVGSDTLVSHAFDLARYANNEFQPEFPDSGGVVRTGNFADDEFMVVCTDTVTNPIYIGQPNQYDDTSHIPMGIKVVQRSYSWSDTNYDNIVIVELTIKNILSNDITDAWVGFYMDPDIYSIGPGGNSTNGYADDFTGILDTLLYDDDPNSRVLIPYATDNDGDPDYENDFVWNNASARHAVSLGLLYTTIPNPTINYNWWVFDFANGNYGPRRLGTPEDPFRTFIDSSLGEPQRMQDVYYTMAHPEIDFDQLLTATIDSSDGWIPAPNPEALTDFDTRFFYSFGPFDLLPGDTQKVVIAIVGTDDFHRDPEDYYNLFNPASPDAYMATLNFENMVRQHRKADSLYQSGYELPRPGPPVGLKVTSFNEDQINLTWNKKGDPNTAGYFVSVRIPEYYDAWHHAHIAPITDTTYAFKIPIAGAEAFFAVSAVDNLGRESLRSFWTSCTTGKPQPPVNVQLEADGLSSLLSWESACDTCLHGFYIYRATDDGSFSLFDSTATLNYRDTDVQSGVLYRYYVVAVTSTGVMSDPSAIVQTLPQALDHKILFYDLNFNPSSAIDAFRPEYVGGLIESVESSVDIDYVHIDATPITQSKLSEYEVVIFDYEKEGGRLNSQILDEISLYLKYGGKALFIMPNATTYTITRQFMQIGRYGEGQILHDIFHFDSSLANKMVFSAGSLYGDLLGCASHDTDYPVLTADSNKLVLSTLPNEGGIPLAGCLYPIDGDVDTLYTYISLYPDSILHEQVNGIRYSGDGYTFIFFNFPLSLMESPANTIAFRQALGDLGFNLTCGDFSDDGVINLGDVIAYISYLYRGGNAPPDTWRADVNCDGAVSLGDALILINHIFRHGSAPACCLPGE